MDKIKRGDDAADHAPRPTGTEEAATSGKRDSPNYRDRVDDGRSIPAEDLNSANDE